LILSELWFWVCLFSLSLLYLCSILPVSITCSRFQDWGCTGLHGLISYLKFCWIDLVCHFCWEYLLGTDLCIIGNRALRYLQSSIVSLVKSLLQMQWWGRICNLGHMNHVISPQTGIYSLCTNLSISDLTGLKSNAEIQMFEQPCMQLNGICPDKLGPRYLVACHCFRYPEKLGDFKYFTRTMIVEHEFLNWCLNTPGGIEIRCWGYSTVLGSNIHIQTQELELASIQIDFNLIHADLVNVVEEGYPDWRKIDLGVLSSGVTDGGKRGKLPPPWQAKCKNWAPFSWHFYI